MQGRHFLREYLEYKLNIGDILAVEIIGNQREVWAVEGLKRYAAGKGTLPDSARGALAMIGTNEAIRALEESLIPGGHSRANTQLVMLLQLHGDKASSEFLKKLSLDERFGERERAYFDYASKTIEKRIKEE
jgi:hypothetical protein